MILLAKLTINQKRFADEFIISGNATDAYLKAYKSVKRAETAAANGSRMLRNAKVKVYIDERLAELEDKAIAKQNEVLKYLTSVMRGESVSEIVVVEGQGDGCSAARRVDKTPDEKERLKAAELLNRRYGTPSDLKEQEARIKRLEAETERIIEETARKSGKKGIDEAENQVSAIAELINNPDSERVLSEFMGGAEDASDADEPDPV